MENQRGGDINQMESQVGGDRRDYNKWITKTLEDFFNAYYNGDRLKLYSFFDTDFQKEVPLNIFLYHPQYVNMELGELQDILSISLSQLKFEADVKILLKERSKTSQINIKLKKEYGKWKIIASYIF